LSDSSLERRYKLRRIFGVTNLLLAIGGFGGIADADYFEFDRPNRDSIARKQW
jgi:hypothetical protein